LELLAQSRVKSAYFVVARRGKNASARSSSARRRAISRRSQLLQAPDVITSRDQHPAQRGYVDAEDHLRLGTKRVDGRGSCNQRTYHDDASTCWPWMIIKHPSHSIDQLRQAFPTVRCDMRVVQPGVQCAAVLERNVDQRSRGPCPEVAFAQLRYRFGLSAKT
jgi:hypothetical protein